MSLHLCTTYDSHRPDLLKAVLPYVHSLEITPDSIANWHHDRPQLDERILADLSALGPNTSLLVHGVGLSIGTAEGMNGTYLSLLGDVLDRLPVQWHSEHLGFVTADGENLNAMLPLPRTEEALQLLTDRVNALQDQFGLPFLLENIAHLIPTPAPTYSEADFLNELTYRTGCGLILDLYNLVCDEQNYGFDTAAFLRRLNRDAVRELHVAGGTILDNFWLDVHSDRVADETMQWVSYVLDPASPGYCPHAEVLTYEIMPQAVAFHGDAFVVDELRRLHQFLQTYELANVSAAVGTLR